MRTAYALPSDRWSTGSSTSSLTFWSSGVVRIRFQARSMLAVPGVAGTAAVTAGNCDQSRCRPGGSHPAGHGLDPVTIPALGPATARTNTTKRSNPAQKCGRLWRRHAHPGPGIAPRRHLAVLARRCGAGEPGRTQCRGSGDSVYLRLPLYIKGGIVRRLGPKFGRQESVDGRLRSLQGALQSDVGPLTDEYLTLTICIE